MRRSPSFGLSAKEGITPHVAPQIRVSACIPSLEQQTVETTIRQIIRCAMTRDLKTMDEMKLLIFNYIVDDFVDYHIMKSDFINSLTT